MHWTLTLSQDLQVFMSQRTPPTFPFTSALPISFSRPGLFGRGENTGDSMPNFFHRVGLVFFFFFFLGGGGKLEGGEKKMQISGEPMPIFFTL